MDHPNDNHTRGSQTFFAKEKLLCIIRELAIYVPLRLLESRICRFQKRKPSRIKKQRHEDKVFIMKIFYHKDFQGPCTATRCRNGTQAWHEHDIYQPNTNESIT